MGGGKQRDKGEICMAKILVIDDDISLLQLIKNALEYDHSITTYTGCPAYLFEK